MAFIMDVLARDDLPFPRSLPEFQRLFPDDAACAAYLEKARWSQGFVCPWCGNIAEPFRFENRPGVLRCRACRKDVGLTAGTVMEKSHTPLSVWFWAAYLVASQTPGISAVQFQRQLGLSRWSDPIRIASVDSLASMSRLMKPGSEAGRVARVAASTIRRWSPVLSRSATGSPAPLRTRGRMAVTPVASG
jgi:hypothetical protein